MLLERGAGVLSDKRKPIVAPLEALRSLQSTYS
jgi:hypothetical protein